MSDDSPAGQPAPGRQFSIRKIYLKDASFESPGTPEIFTRPWEPDLDLHLPFPFKQAGVVGLEFELERLFKIGNGEFGGLPAEVGPHDCDRAPLGFGRRIGRHSVARATAQLGRQREPRRGQVVCVPRNSHR